MSPSERDPKLPHVVWAFWGSLTKLDAASWLETTRELRKLGWRVTLIAAGEAGPQQVQGVEVHCIHRPRIYFFWQFAYHLQLLLLLARRWSDIDVILFHQMSAPWLLPLRIVRLFTRKPRPLIVMDTRTVHMARKDEETCKQKLNGWFHCSMNTLANYLADGQTAITKRMAEVVKIPPGQLWGVWPSGVCPDNFAAARTARRWPGHDEPIALVYVGVLHYERNLMALCRAVEAANAEGMRFTLSLLGSGTQGAQLEQFAIGTEGRIAVLPPVPHDRVPQSLADGHVGVLPFPDEEKFRVSSPIKLFEYMASGLPIMATRIDCHTDVVGPANFAFWAEDASVEGLLAALRQIWNDHNSLAGRGKEAASAATSWTWKESAKSLKTALEYGVATASTAAPQINAHGAPDSPGNLSEVDGGQPLGRRRNGNTGSVALRDFPFPYRAALAICSDIDQTRSIEEFLEIQRFLSTKQTTSMGEGVGLDIGNSFFFYDDEHEFSFFNRDDRTKGVILDFARAGYLDCLHSFGDAVRGRDDALRALEVLDREDCKLEVWINHFGSRSNLCPKFEYMLGTAEGDDAASDCYHADATIDYGIRYVWVGATTRLVGQSPDGSSTLLSVCDPRHPLASSLNVLKETRKKTLGLLGDKRFMLARHNQLMRPLRLGDGQHVHEFMRYCNHPSGVAAGATSRGLAYAISGRALRRLKEAQGYMIVYTHLGKNNGCIHPVAAETRSALRALEREHRDGQIYVTTTVRLLNYHRAHRFVSWSAEAADKRTRIHVNAIADPAFGKESPTVRQLQGLTFYVPCSAEADVYVCGTKLQNIQPNPADFSGRESVTIPPAALQWPI